MMDIPKLIQAAIALYYAGHWRLDSDGDPKHQLQLWTNLRDALGLPLGTAPKATLPSTHGWWTIDGQPCTEKEARDTLIGGPRRSAMLPTKEEVKDAKSYHEMMRDVHRSFNPFTDVPDKSGAK